MDSFATYEFSDPATAAASQPLSRPLDAATSPEGGDAPRDEEQLGAGDGADLGIGFKLTAALAALPETIVFAGARDPDKLSPGDENDNRAAIVEIQATAPT
ncbi:hypothetical protein DFH07DRAFT_990915 [Mycena maculata]|uniref:Uncharacterized protein n=1 Tax=Mycena maculata TaxID=230809 RepID=A0AAD7I0B2_9AGAR|nr:hypothetical protein DFH07DRAFT_990915 [Mycena maculata]